MDPNGNTSGTVKKKVKFVPKGLPRRTKPNIVKKEETDAADLQGKEMLRRFHESTMKGKPKIEKKLSSSQFAFGHGGSSASMKNYGQGAGAPGSSLDKEYKEPWDYYSDYPVTLPLRRPYAGDPAILNKEEFGEDSKTKVHNEDSINPAKELGLTEEKEDEKSLTFFQFPGTMPMMKNRSATASDANNNNPNSLKKKNLCKFNELPAGYMGKMLIYKSGAVKLKLGDNIYDVNPGVNCSFAQDVVAINIEEKDCCVLGELNKRATVVPNLNSVLDNKANL